METLWLSPVDFVSGDPSLCIEYPHTSHPDVVVGSTAPGDFKWVFMGLRLPEGACLEKISITYQVSNCLSFISQVRLLEMSTPGQALVIFDDPTDLKSMAPATQTYSLAKQTTPGRAVTLALRLNYQYSAPSDAPNHIIKLGAVGVTVTNLARTLVVKNVAALKALAVSAFRSGQIVNVLGYCDAEDGGGGLFEYRDSPGTEDGGIVFVPGAGSGHYRRLHDRGIEARWFGARGDGVSINEVPIQRAVDAAHAAGGGEVSLGPGTYVVRGAIYMKDGVVLRGAGMLATSVRIKIPRDIDMENTPPFHQSVLVLAGCCQTGVMDLTIDGARASRTPTLAADDPSAGAWMIYRNGIAIVDSNLNLGGGTLREVLERECSDCRITRVRVVNAPCEGIFINGARRVTVEDSEVWGSRNFGISIGTYTSFCVVRRTRGRGNSHGDIQLLDGRRHLIERCWFPSVILQHFTSRSSPAFPIDTFHQIVGCRIGPSVYDAALYIGYHSGVTVRDCEIMVDSQVGIRVGGKLVKLRPLFGDFSNESFPTAPTDPLCVRGVTIVDNVIQAVPPLSPNLLRFQVPYQTPQITQWFQSAPLNGSSESQKLRDFWLTLANGLYAQSQNLFIPLDDATILTMTSSLSGPLWGPEGKMAAQVALKAILREWGDAPRLPLSFLMNYLQSAPDDVFQPVPPLDPMQAAVPEPSVEFQTPWDRWARTVVNPGDPTLSYVADALSPKGPWLRTPPWADDAAQSPAVVEATGEPPLINGIQRYLPVTAIRAEMCRGMTIRGNRISGQFREGIVLRFVRNSSVDGNSIEGARVPPPVSPDQFPPWNPAPAGDGTGDPWVNPENWPPAFWAGVVIDRGVEDTTILNNRVRGFTVGLQSPRSALSPYVAEFWPTGNLAAMNVLRSNSTPLEQSPYLPPTALETLNNLD